MDYEKAYKEARERAKAGKPMNEVFPELKESEDEKIRKELIRFFKQTHNWANLKYDGDEIVAYLEKQKYEYEVFEPVESTLEYKMGFKDGVESVKQKEQKPAELPKSEDYGIDGLYAAVDILQKTLGEVDGYETDDGILEHECAISAVKELYEQKPAEWHREDEQNLNVCLSYIKDASLRSWLIDAIHVRYDKPAEWSEEDEDCLKRAIWYVENPAPSVVKDTNLALWLKSLRSKPHWKPSKEQMEALDTIIRNCHYPSFDISLLRELRDGLEKL